MKSTNFLFLNTRRVIKKTCLIAINLMLGYFVTAQTLSDNGLFYYSSNRAIPLNVSTTKAIVKLTSENYSINTLIKSSGLPSENFQVDTMALKTFQLTSPYIKYLIRYLNTREEVYTVQPVYVGLDGSEKGVTNEFLVQFKKTATPEEIEELNLYYGVSIMEEEDLYFVLSIPEKGNVLQIANSYYQSGIVTFAHPNFIILNPILHFSPPNDTYFSYQFGLYNTGQETCNGKYGTSGADIDALHVWDITSGAGTVVAVIDCGVDHGADDLPEERQLRLPGSNFAVRVHINEDPNDPKSLGMGEYTYHGIACAGLIGAERNNGKGISGIAPESTIMPIRVGGEGLIDPDIKMLADAIKFAVNNGADIISNSWGLGFDSYDAIETAIEQAMKTGRNGLGTILVFSVGNGADHTKGNGWSPNYITHYPANTFIPYVISVGASDRNDHQSNYSPSSDFDPLTGYIVDIVAPSSQDGYGNITGESYEVYTLDNPGAPGFVSGDYMCHFGGTSAAAPLVSGVAALVLSVNPCLTAEDVFNILTTTADKVGGYTYLNGQSLELGAGRVNAYKAVLAASNTYNAGSDLHIRDLPNDFGEEPNKIEYPRDKYHTIMWASEDIWNRHTDDGIYEHQNPEYPNLNYVYMRVRNKGCENYSGGTAELKVYWAKGSTALAWPGNWENYTDNTCGSTIYYGDQITNRSPLHTSPIYIPALAPGEFADIPVSWYPPNPEDFSCFGGEKSHFCLLARIVWNSDPMHSTEINDIYFNVKENNNIAWKNVSIICPGCRIGETVIRNMYESPVLTRLYFSAPDPAFSFLNHGVVKVNLGTNLFQKWVTGGNVGNDVEICNDTLLLITGPNPWIGNISLDTSEMSFVKFDFELIVQPSNVCEFKFDVAQYDSSLTDTSFHSYRIAGGVRFIIQGCEEPELRIAANDPVNKEGEIQNTFKLYPNPNTGTMQLDYELQSQEQGVLSIYNLTGRKVSSYILNEGKNTLQIKEPSLAGGIYFYDVRVNNKQVVRGKVVIVK